MSVDRERTGVRVLIAEDDPSIGLAVRAIVRKSFACERVAIAEDGEQAWEALHRDRYDVVIADWNMPRRTGAELLRDVRGHPTMARLPVIMLTARSDRDSLVEAARAGVTDYVVKPFAKRILVEKVARLLHEGEGPGAGGARPGPDAGDVVKEVRQRFEQGTTNLAALPRTYVKLGEAARSGYLGDAEIARIITTDPASMAAVIRLANSAFFRATGAPVRSLKQAIARVGLDHARACVLFVHSREMFARGRAFSGLRQRLWMHSVAVAAAARATAERAEVENPEELFAMGLLHDVGKLVVLQLSAEIEPLPATGLILQACDRTHERIGADLLRRWELPVEFVRVARSHHAPGNASGSRLEVATVHFADCLADAMGHAFRGGDEDGSPLAEAAGRLALEQETVDEIRDVTVQGIRDLLAAPAPIPAAGAST